jgi:hypothetical protein
LVVDTENVLSCSLLNTHSLYFYKKTVTCENNFVITVFELL